jgi:hypothetical protein
MAYDREHLYLRMLGNFADGVDEWSVGLRLASPTLTVPATGGLNAFLAAVSTPIATFHNNTAVFAGGSTKLVGLSVAKIGVDGHYNPQTQDTTTFFYPTPISGGGSAGAARSTAFVTSLRTSKPRGYASNGRFYYPATAAVTNFISGMIPESGVTPYLDAAKIMFNAINSAGLALAVPVKICVMSTHGAGLSDVVTAIRADGRLDRQERRENKLAAPYFTLSLT